MKKLRSRVKSLGRALCAPNKLITRENTDLAKMFTECSRAIPHEIDSANGKKICVLSNCRKVRFTSGVTLPSTSSDRESAEDKFSPSELFQRLNDLVVENERYKVEESKYEKQCSQLLSKNNFGSPNSILEKNNIICLTNNCFMTFRRCISSSSSKP